MHGISKQKQLFVSYSRTDEPFVHRIVADLDRKGVACWLDAKEIRVGDSVSARIEEGIEQADLFCLCLSRASVQSDWVLREYRTALTMQLRTSGARPRILPLLIETCDIPALLMDIKYADFATSYLIGFHALCHSLSIPPDWEVPYKGLIEHIESVEPLDSFLSVAHRAPIRKLYRKAPASGDL